MCKSGHNTTYLVEILEVVTSGISADELSPSRLAFLGPDFDTEVIKSDPRCRTTAIDSLVLVIVHVTVFTPPILSKRVRRQWKRGDMGMQASGDVYVSVLCIRSRTGK